MVTGDNGRTAISVARDCGIVSQSAHVFYPAFVVGTSLLSSILDCQMTSPSGNANVRHAKLEWSSVDDESLKLDDYNLRPLPPPPHHVVTSDEDEIAYSDYALMLTGDVFRWMVNHAPLETLQRVSLLSPIFVTNMLNDIRCS